MITLLLFIIAIALLPLALRVLLVLVPLAIIGIVGLWLTYAVFHNVLRLV